MMMISPSSFVLDIEKAQGRQTNWRGGATPGSASRQDVGRRQIQQR
jgi:hypothetical protein